MDYKIMFARPDGELFVVNITANNAADAERKARKMSKPITISKKWMKEVGK